MRILKQSSLAAGLLVVVTLGILWGLLGRGAGVAWGDVVDKMQEVHAVRCKIAMDIAIAGKAPDHSTLHMLMTDTGWDIVENDEHTSKTVTNFVQGAQLMLMNKSKLAIKTEYGNAMAAQVKHTLLDELKRLDRKGEKSLGEKDVGGVHARGFQVASADGMEMEIWVDPNTERPVMVLSTISAEAIKSMLPVASGPITAAYTEFDWNPEVDPKELSFDVPAGYHLETIKVDATTPATEVDVVAMLKAVAELNGGVYADGATMMDSMAVIGKWGQAQKAELKKNKANVSDDAAKDEIMKKLMPQTTAISRGWLFMGMAVKGSDWHYAGKGVKAGEKGTPILWYKTAAGTWRVIDADLTVHEAREADLPKGEAVNLQPMTMPTGTGSPATMHGTRGLP